MIWGTFERSIDQLSVRFRVRATIAIGFVSRYTGAIWVFDVWIRGRLFKVGDS